MTQQGPLRKQAAGIRTQALAWLAQREYSNWELRRRLNAKGFDPEPVAEVLKALVDEGLLSDQRFVESFVRSRAERGYGPQRIGAELRERRIDDGLIEACLDEYAEEWSLRARAAYRKKYGSSPCDDLKERMRRKRFLHYRGFTGEQIRSLFEDSD